MIPITHKIIKQEKQKFSKRNCRCKVRKDLLLGLLSAAIYLLIISNISAQDKTEKIILKNYKGEEIFSYIPEGYEINRNENGQYTLTNRYASSNSILKIGSNNFRLKIGSSVIINEQRLGNQGTITIKLEGEGDIILGVLTRTAEGDFGGNELNDIKDAVIKISEEYSEISGLEAKSSEISFAEFTSVNGGEYIFYYKKGEYKFIAKEGGKIIFNPKEGVIEGKETDLEISGNEDIKQISLSGSSRFKDSNGNSYSSEASDILKIFLDGRDIKNEKNAISFGDGKISLKGKVEITNGLNYKGLTATTYTELDTKNNVFDVKQGDVIIDNNKHKILVENGKIKLENKNLASDEYAESFIVRYSEEDRVTEAILDESSGNLKLISSKQGYPTQTALIPLLSYQGSLNDPLEIQRNFIKEMENILEGLKASGASQEKIDSLELVIANAKNRQYENYLGTQGGLDFSIKELRGYLEKPRTSESKLNAQITLAESLIERASLGAEHMFGDSLIEMLEKDKEFSYQKKRYLEEAQELFNSIKQSAIEQNNLGLSGYADLRIGNIYEFQENYDKALRQYYDTAEQNPLNEIKSEAYRYAAEIKIQQENYKSALQDLYRATILDPNNKQAKDFEVKLSLDIIKAVDKNLNGELDALWNEVNEKLGIGEYESLFKTPSKAFGLFWKDAGEIIFGDPYDNLNEFKNRYDSVQMQKIGTIGLSSLLVNGVDLEEFRSAKYSERRNMMAKALPEIYLGRVDEFIEASVHTLQNNADIALVAAKGDEQKARKILRERRDPSFEPDGKQDWELNEFGFKTDKRYAGEIKKTWGDTISRKLSGGNIVGLMAGGPIVKGVGWGARSIGLGKAIQQANRLKMTAGEALGLTTFARNFPKIAGTVRFGAETGIFYGVDTLAPDWELGMLISSGVSHTGILDFRGALTKAGLKAIKEKILYNAKGEAAQLLRFKTKQEAELAKQILKGRKNIIILSTGEEIPKTILERGFVKSVEIKAIPELISREAAWKQVAVGDVAISTRREIEELIADLSKPMAYNNPNILTEKIFLSEIGGIVNLHGELDIATREAITRASIKSNREVAVIGDKMIIGRSGYISFSAKQVEKNTWWHTHLPQGTEVDSNIIPSGATTPMGRLTFYQLPTSYNPGVGTGDFGEAIANGVKELKISGIVKGEYKELSYRVPSYDDYIKWTQNPVWKKVNGIELNEPLMRYSLGNDWERLISEVLPK